MKVRTRFAPSPTGFIHIGGLRTALYAFALAKHEQGDFILRIEDTDQKREVQGSTDAIQKTLKKFGIEWDEFYVQSERHKTGIYKNAAEKLVSSGNAFYCQCDPKNSKEKGYSNSLRDECRDKGLGSGAIKLKVPDSKQLSYYDFVHRKEISWNSDTVYDATLLKSDGFPTYHLAAMVDDMQMEISHILRGHDWLPSTPIHLLVFEYLGGKKPHIGHLSDILSAETGKKLSKRRDSVFAEQFLEDGYLPSALLNFIMLLGWAPKDNRELFTLQEFVKEFDINGFQETNPRFLKDKLDWFNGEYIRNLTNEDLNSKFQDSSEKFVKLSKEKQLAITKLIKDRIRKISEIESLAGFFWDEPEVDKSIFGKNYKEHLATATELIKNIDKWDLHNLNQVLITKVKEKGYKTGDFFMDLRIAITGTKFTPPINDSIIILGKEKTLKRIKVQL